MNYYDILNVSKNASQKEIKNSYKKLVKKYHPDVYAGDKSFADKKIKEINSAYDVLSNEDLKKEYDATITPIPSYDSYNEYYNNYKERYSNYDTQNNYTSSSNDVYEKYKNVYNNYANKYSNYKSTSYYTNTRENYSNYYKASAYRTPSSSYSHENKAQEYVYKKLSNFSKLQLLVLFGAVYVIALIFIISDFSKVHSPNTKVSASSTSDTSIYDTSYYNYLYNDSNNEISSNSYKDSYILGDYEFTLEDLRDAYIKYYSSKFSSFSEFMEFIEYAEEYL